jgi:hypothetical protein
VTVESTTPILKVAGDEWKFAYVWEDKTGVPIQMTDYVVELVLKGPGGYASNHTGTVTSAPAGRFEIVIDEAVTGTLTPGIYRAFVRLTSPLEDPYTVIIELLRVVA